MCDAGCLRAACLCGHAFSLHSMSTLASSLLGQIVFESHDQVDSVTVTFVCCSLSEGVAFGEQFSESMYCQGMTDVWYLSWIIDTHFSFLFW